MEEPGWNDTYMPEGCEEYLKALSKADVAPLSPREMSVLEAVETSVTERVSKRKIVVLSSSKTKKALRTTHPSYRFGPFGVMRALLRGSSHPSRRESSRRLGSVHPDQRCGSAQYQSREQYLSVLHTEGADVSNAGLLNSAW